MPALDFALFFAYCVTVSELRTTCDHLRIEYTYQQHDLRKVSVCFTAYRTSTVSCPPTHTVTHTGKIPRGNSGICAVKEQFPRAEKRRKPLCPNG